MKKPCDPGGITGAEVDVHIQNGHDFNSVPPRPQARKRQQPERQLQAALIEHLNWRAPAGTWWTHFPAGGRRSRVTGAILKPSHRAED
jgi:hypothetical protein